jgi:hypothetical protein
MIPWYMRKPVIALGAELPARREAVAQSFAAAKGGMG